MKSALILIRKRAADLRPGMRVKLRHLKSFWGCVAAANETKGGFACLQRGTRKMWISDGYKCLIPLEDDSVLGMRVSGIADVGDRAEQPMERGARA